MSKIKKSILKIFNNDETNINTIVHSAQSRHLTDIHRVQNGLLIWLDANINEKTDENSRKNIILLENIINNINIFTNSKECIHFLNETINEKIFLIISGTFGEHLIHEIHNLNQIDSIYIYSIDKLKHEQWTKQWIKIKGIFTNMSLLCDILKQTIEEYEKNSISISFLMANNNNNLDENFNELQQTFLYTQILKDILLTIKFKKKNFNEFIEYCQQCFINNKTELEMIEKLKCKYNKKVAIQWYTRECFLYRMVNRALRLMEIDNIINMGFFIQDLHHQIKYLHTKQFYNRHTSKPFFVYRGQRLSKHNFEQINLAKGNLLSFNTFLSTTTNRNVSITFAQSGRTNSDLINVIFVMNIDPYITLIPFASIKDISYSRNEDEILFSIHTVFRIGNITQTSENNNIWQIDLIQINENDHELFTVMKRLQDETEGYTGWDRLGRFFIKLGLYDKAQFLYETLLKTTTDDYERANIFNQLGWINNTLNQYENATLFYNDSLAIIERISPNDLNNLASIYTDIGILHTRMDDYTRALSDHEKALELRKKIFHEDHPGLADTYNNLGLVYLKKNDLSMAHLFLEKSFKMREKYLPSYHPDLAKSYSNLGLLYKQMNENAKANVFHQKALEIRQKILLPNHPDLNKAFKCIEALSDNSN